MTSSRATALSARLALHAVDAAYLKHVEALGATVRSTDATASVRPGMARVTQSQLDRADGLNLLVMGQLIDAFRDAHAIDSTISRLVPVATKTYFTRKPHKAAAATTEPAPQAQPKLELAPITQVAPKAEAK